MSELKMPAERLYGWKLKPTESTHFDIVSKPNGQFCVVLNHSLLRGVSSEMIHWWFLHFPHIRVRLEDVPGFEGTKVPGYYLWHPSDHYNASLSGRLGPGNTSRAGATIRVQEAMQYKKYGWKYKVDSNLKILYCESDGWAMGKEIPFFGKAMVLRIHYKDAFQNGKHVGVHYHYEIVVGVSGGNPISRLLNRRITGNFSQEFFEAWHLHNAIEVGTFENFLPAIFEQRESPDALTYRKSLNSIRESHSQEGFSRELFEDRVRSYQKSNDVYAVQAWGQESFIT